MQGTGKDHYLHCQSNTSQQAAAANLPKRTPALFYHNLREQRPGLTYHSTPLSVSLPDVGDLQWPEELGEYEV